jgi:glycosyltransferase involved in cell wall biosynthesis
LTAPRRLRTVHLASWPDNPYQQLLAGHLGHLGIAAEELAPRIIFLPRLARRGRPDILHVHDATVFSPSPRLLGSAAIAIISIVQLAILKLLGVVIVWTVHDLKHHEKHAPTLVDRAVARILARMAGAIITHCHSAKILAARELRCPRDRLFVIPHGNYIGAYANTVERGEARAELRIPPGRLVLLCFGLLRPYKGLACLIERFRGAGDAGMHLIIAGKPVDAGLAEQIARQVSGMANVTYVPGYIPDDRVQVYMQAADAVVFAYRDILTSGTLVLAMSFGRACIAPRIGCIPDMLDEVGGFLYDAGSGDGLSDAIERARVSDLAAMGAHNLRVAESWSWDRVAAMTAEVYEWCRRGGEPVAMRTER